MNNDGQATKKEKVLKVPCEVYDRIVGYLRPVQNWNAGKQEEQRNRKRFKLPKQRETWHEEIIA